MVTLMGRGCFRRQPRPAPSGGAPTLPNFVGSLLLMTTAFIASDSMFYPLTLCALQIVFMITITATRSAR